MKGKRAEYASAILGVEHLASAASSMRVRGLTTGSAFDGESFLWRSAVRRWLIAVVFAAIAGVAAVLFTSLRLPMVDAKAELMSFAQLKLEDPLPRFEVRSANETVEEMQSPTVRRVARARLGHDPKVYFKVRADTIVEIHARAVDPRIAAEDATGFTEAYVDWKRDWRAAELLNAEAAVQAEVARLRTQVSVVARSGQPHQTFPLEMELNKRNVKLEFIQEEIKSSGTSGDYLVMAAATPTKPFFANPLWVGALASALMLIFTLRVSR